jgi:hypothetical protein
MSLGRKNMIGRPRAEGPKNSFPKLVMKDTSGNSG